MRSSIHITNEVKTRKTSSALDKRYNNLMQSKYHWCYTYDVMMYIETAQAFLFPRSAAYLRHEMSSKSEPNARLCVRSDVWYIRTRLTFSEYSPLL